MDFFIGDVKTATAVFVNAGGGAANIDLSDKTPTWSVLPEGVAEVIQDPNFPLQAQVRMLVEATGVVVSCVGADADLDPGEIRDLTVSSEAFNILPAEATGGSVVFS